MARFVSVLTFPNYKLPIFMTNVLQVLKLTGDQREGVKKFLISSGLATAENIRIHGV